MNKIDAYNSLINATCTSIIRVSWKYAATRICNYITLNIAISQACAARRENVILLFHKEALSDYAKLYEYSRL